MLEDLVQKPFALARHRSTLFGPYLEDYFGSLRSQGYADVVLRRDLFVITRFGEHLARRRIQRLVDIGDSAVVGFMRREKRRLRQCNHRARQLADIRRIVDGLLQQLGVRAADDHMQPGFMTDFYRWLSVDRGLQPITIAGYRHFLDRLLRHLGSDGSAESLSGLSAGDVDAFVVVAGCRYGRKSMSQACTAIRALLRFLYLRGVLSHDLSLTVVMPKFYALERLAQRQLEILLATIRNPHVVREAKLPV
jgi:site-specific recombinase XerC